MVKIELLEISCYAYGLLKPSYDFSLKNFQLIFFFPVYTLFRLNPLDCTYELAQDECACADTDLHAPRPRAWARSARARLAVGNIIAVQLTSAKRLALANYHPVCAHGPTVLTNPESLKVVAAHLQARTEDHAV